MKIGDLVPVRHQRTGYIQYGRLAGVTPGGSQIKVRVDLDDGHDPEAVRSFHRRTGKLAGTGKGNLGWMIDADRIIEELKGTDGN
jgi:hypothetical protein